MCSLLSLQKEGQEQCALFSLYIKSDKGNLLSSLFTKKWKSYLLFKKGNRSCALLLFRYQKTSDWHKNQRANSQPWKNAKKQTINLLLKSLNFLLFSMYSIRVSIFSSVSCICYTPPQYVGEGENTIVLLSALYFQLKKTLNLFLCIKLQFSLADWRGKNLWMVSSHPGGFYLSSLLC